MFGEVGDALVGEVEDWGEGLGWKLLARGVSVEVDAGGYHLTARQEWLSEALVAERNSDRFDLRWWSIQRSGVPWRWWRSSLTLASR